MDPAEQARKRREEIEMHLGIGEVMDEQARELVTAKKDPTQMRLIAIDARVKAICLHLGLRTPDADDD